MKPTLADQSQPFNGSEFCDRAGIQGAIDCAIATAGINDSKHVDHVAAVENAIRPSQRCEIFRLLGATVEMTAVIKLPARGLWVTVSDLAKRLRISKQAASKRIQRLENAGVLQTRSGPGGTKLVNLGQFDKAAGELNDAVRELSGPTGDHGEGRADILCFVPETLEWACGGRSGRGFVAAIAALFSVDDQADAAGLIYEALGRGLIEARAAPRDDLAAGEGMLARPAEPSA